MSWTIRVEHADLQSHTFALQAKDGCFLSANTKLAGYDKAVTLTSEALAERFRAAILGVMKKRHGEDVELIVEPGGQRKSADDELVNARISQGVFAPNKRPAL
ncbi:hypothetical protein [Burkholderia sp. SRS-W-2-2016]|uniref:hypothetical protein n=1 Tax=Burkholderia sp. SRS-W-2-2016 TaxID=1926878 RepID=UPI001180648A|nr:hypothetical protein [Burkholderia sp. SRS-W-2-2016]